MRLLKVACDGCDLTEIVTLPLGGKSDLIFDGWIAHRAVVYENGSEAYEILADLCPECADKMRRASNPANWPRLKVVPRDRTERSVA